MLIGVLLRLNRPADLDSEADAAPGLGTAQHALAELVEQGCAEVIATTNPDSLIVIALSGAGIDRRSRVEALPRSRAPTESRCLCPWGLEPHVSEVRVGGYIHTGAHR